MVNYACAFSQSDLGKYFEWIIIYIINTMYISNARWSTPGPHLRVNLMRSPHSNYNRPSGIRSLCCTNLWCHMHLFSKIPSALRWGLNGGMSLRNGMWHDLRNSIILRNLIYGKWRKEKNSTGKHRPIRLTQCCTQFKPFGNKTFCFRNFHII